MILSQNPQHEGKEDSSQVEHTSTKVTLLLSESISTSLQRVSHPQVSHERCRRFLPIHTYSSASFHHLVDPTIKTTRAHILWELNM